MKQLGKAQALDILAKDYRDADGKLKVLKFGTNVDLSDERKWKAQVEVCF